MLNLTYKRYQNGEAVSEDELRGMLGRKRAAQMEYVFRPTCQ